MIVVWLTAPPASAITKKFRASPAPPPGGNVVLAGTQTTTNAFTTDSGTIHCSSTTFSGSTAAESSEATLTVLHADCKSTGFIEANVTIDANECHLIKHAAKTHPNGDFTSSQLTLVNCNPPTHSLAITAPFCTITIPSGQTLSTLEFTNGGSGTTREITTHFNVTNLKYSESGFACKNSGSSTTGGTYSGSAKFTGTYGGSHVGIWYE